MGREAKCRATHGSESGEGKALLETNEIIFRGAFRLVIPFKEIKSLEVKGDALHVAFGKDKASFALGEAEAAKWLKSIQNPKSVLDKLGVKSGQRVSIIGLEDETFEAQLRTKGAEIIATPKSAIDHLFVVVDSVDDFPKLKKLKSALASTGALWVLRPKGRKDITESQVRAAGLATGLVDVKVVGFSDILSAEKYVIPLKDRHD